ncbi:4'-phosphopantetheinyl transferase superfamily protein [Gracilimonas sp.]|uniref:4'-phosphopantetheinyl transferase family protein n=1 Tax=Gracilimonas sp. TaxID=1974203 RepID=UPI0025BE0211|nr:4'-phosphopantetheinyl transferase superfamily protein [Gracilimonas sp.]
MKIVNTSHIKNWPNKVILGVADISSELPTGILSPSESKEYDSFKNLNRKAEYLSARTLLKFLLSSSEVDEKNVILSREEGGKPFAKLGDEHLHVSFSHSPHKVYCALSKKFDIGVDVEPLKRKIPLKLVNRILSDSEKKKPNSLNPIQVWTIKEAVVKLLGTGLRTNLNELSIEQNEKSQIYVRFNNEKLIEICSFSQSDHQIALAYQSLHI